MCNKTANPQKTELAVYVHEKVSGQQAIDFMSDYCLLISTDYFMENYRLQRQAQVPFLFFFCFFLLFLSRPITQL